MAASNRRSSWPPSLKRLWHDSSLITGSGISASRWATFRILLELRQKSLRPTARLCRQNIFGFQWDGYNPRTLLYLFRDLFLYNTYNFPCSHDHPRIVDCGANIGMSVLFFKLRYPSAEVHAFEPNPDAFKLLSDNLARNHLTGVKVHNACLSHVEGPCRFFVGEETASLTSSIFQSRGGAREIRVNGVRLSNYLHSLGQVDMVKIDVEGAETPVIYELVQNQALRLSPAYIIEYHHHINGRSSELSLILSALERNGFSYFLKDTYQQGAFQDILLRCQRAA